MLDILPQTRAQIKDGELFVLHFNSFTDAGKSNIFYFKNPPKHFYRNIPIELSKYTEGGKLSYFRSLSPNFHPDTKIYSHFISCHIADSVLAKGYLYEDDKIVVVPGRFIKDLIFKKGEDLSVFLDLTRASRLYIR